VQIKKIYLDNHPHFGLSSIVSDDRLRIIDNRGEGLSEAIGLDPHFSAIEPISLRELVIGAIREAILNGKLSPGERIVESRLAKEMKVGQSAVREALQELEFQGFVVRVANKGAFVTDFSFNDISDIYRVRMELEGFAAQLARECGRPTADDVSQMERAIEQMQQGADEGDFWKFSRSDLDFHEVIWRSSGNRYLERALRTVATPQFSYVLIRSFHHTRLDLWAITGQHRDILANFKTAEPAACRRYLSALIDDFRQQIERSVTEE
jgi:DNA-binding GntR family transcriptional regulator